MRRYWQARHLATARAAVQAAARGTPTVMTVEGEAGTGKSSFLQELLNQAEQFNVCHAAGSPGSRGPFQVLTQWGIVAERMSNDSQPAALLMAQRLRSFLDRRSAGRPLMLVVDDLHWADRESSQALAWLLRRVAGDRLLVAVTTRPLAPGQHPEWQSLMTSLGGAMRVRLDGLGANEGIAMVRDRRPEISEQSARRLWEHTGGNPLYLASLLAEQDTPTLQRSGALPAPADFAKTVVSKLQNLGHQPVRLARALAVLGTGWSSVSDVAAVAGVVEPESPIERLIEAELAQQRQTATTHEVRHRHALIQAAVYQMCPIGERHELHLAAAQTVTDPRARLEHRFAAAEQHDDALAEALVAAASKAYGRQAFRLSAQYLRWASIVSSSADHRQRLWLDWLFTSALAREFAVVEAERATLDTLDDLSRGLVLGALATVRHDWLEAVRQLTPAQAALSGSDPLLAYRIEALLAWSRIVIGHPVTEIRQGLGRLNELGTRDAGVSHYADIAAGQALSKIDDMYETMQGFTSLSTQPQSIPDELTFVLAFRGVLQLHCGLLSAAIDDFAEAHNRIEAGLVDVSDGGLHGILAWAQWFHGRWDLARVYLRLAREVSGGHDLPIVRTWIPLMAAGAGRFDEADVLINQISAQLEVMPWREAVHALIVTRVVRLHAAADEAAQSRLWEDVIRRFPTTSLHEGVLGPLILTHFALAALWAGRAEVVETYISQIVGVSLHAPWLPAGVAWLRCLQAEKHRDFKAALSYARSAIAFPSDDLPFYRAHVLADHARLATRLGHDAEAEASRAEALEIYTSLDAAPYVARLRSEARLPTSSLPVSGQVLDITERERDILTLVMNGLSYSQIASELFITSSTVSFHLSRLYAKANVRSKHELAVLARRNPAQFGLAPAAV